MSNVRTHVGSLAMSSKAVEHLQANLGLLLRQRKISQQEFSRQVGMDRSFVSRILRLGVEAPSPSLDTLDLLASALGVSTASLISPALIPTPSQPASAPVNSATARQVSRLVEDFLLCGEADRATILREAAARVDAPNERSREA
jgi:transcriptional regulator with XRE-family HTH domain